MLLPFEIKPLLLPMSRPTFLDALGCAADAIPNRPSDKIMARTLT